METAATYKTNGSAKATPSRKELLSNEMAWKEKLLGKYSIVDDLQAYQDAIEKIFRAETENDNLQRVELRKTDQEVEAIRAEIQLDCLSRVDAFGKPLASNAETRKAMLDKELSIDANYQAAVARHRDIQSRIGNLEAEIDYRAKQAVAIKLSIEHKIAAIRLLGL